MSEENKPDAAGGSSAQKPTSARRRYRRPPARWQRRQTTPRPVSATAQKGDLVAEKEQVSSEPGGDLKAGTPPILLPEITLEPEAVLGMPLIPLVSGKTEVPSAPEKPATPHALPTRPATAYKRGGRFQSRHHQTHSQQSAPRTNDPQEDILARFDLITALIHIDAEMIKRFTGTLSTGLKGLKFPGIDAGRAKALLVQFIRDTMEQNGKEKVVAGISGGLDSAIAAYLLVEALGRERITFVHFIETDKNSFIRSRADMVARELHCPLVVEDLRSMLKLVSGKKETALQTRKNRIARERMAALFDLARSKDALVVGGLNKTKILLGVGTEYGDLAFDFNPLGDIYQSQILELARFSHVPSIVIDKVMRPQGPDGQPWDQDIERIMKEMDYYLYQIMDARISLAYLQKLGMEEDKLLWIYRRMRACAFQRVLPLQAEAVTTYVPRAGEL